MSEHTLNECICGNQPKMECYKVGGLYQAVCKKCGRQSVKSTISSKVLTDWNRQTAAPELLAVVKNVEWAGSKTFGYPGGGTGWVGCCPDCMQINPDDVNSYYFKNGSKRHENGCALATAITKAESGS